MKILWICNIILPAIAKHLNLPVPNGGGWLTGLSCDLLQTEEIDLSICFPNKNRFSGNVDGLNYYSFDSDSASEDITGILEKVKPDIIHIFGTEQKHSYDAVNACVKLNLTDKVVINIQGMVSIYASHFMANMPYSSLSKRSFRDFIKGDSIKKSRDNFIKRGKYEIEAIKKVHHIIGRTDWDYACTNQINPDAKYHFCNETLRGSFYENKWSLENCKKHTIFVSQCNYPIKGFHMLLEAMPLILKFFPDAKIYTTGRNLLTQTDLKSKLGLTYYEIYLIKLIKKLGLEEHVVFMGGLNEEKMCKAFLDSHVFVSPSSIENSPNSVGEAMILGVPTISSDVGGVKNMLTHGVEGFVYQFDAPYMLAHYVCEIFRNDDLAKTFSQNARQHAASTHNRSENLKTVLEIYREIGG